MTTSKKTTTKPKKKTTKKTKSPDLTLDSYQNVMARLGAGQVNLQESANYVMTRYTRDFNQINALYRNSWLVRRIVDLIPEDMLKNWGEWQGDLEPDEITILEQNIRRIKLKRTLLEGMRWGRLYGGAAGLMMLDGQDNLEEPLDVSKIMPGDFQGLMIVDRWNGVYPSIQLIDDITSSEFGLPEFYEFKVSEQTRDVNRVHHSRIIRFTGDDLPYWEKIAEMHWGSSKIEAMYDDIRRRDSTASNIGGLIFLACLRIIKMEDLDQILSNTDTEAAQRFHNAISAQNTLMNNFGLQLLGSNDEFQNFQLSNYSGINEVYQSFMMDLSGATGIPCTKLFGRSPAGMNATGESDMRNYYDLIEKEQEAVLMPIMEKLHPVLMMSAYGEIPNLEFVCNPVNTPEETEIADLVERKTNSILAVHDRGVISDRTVLMELKTMGEGTNMYTNITDELIQKANDELPEEGLNATEGFGEIDSLDDRA